MKHGDIEIRQIIIVAYKIRRIIKNIFKNEKVCRDIMLYQN